jgi:hypothetical protein
MHKLTLLLLLFLPMVFLHSCFKSPDSLLIGEWVEESWEMDEKDARMFTERQSDNTIKSHSREVWRFFSDDTFEITKKEEKTIRGKWQILGRGHILKMTYENSGETEVFDIKELNEEQLMLNIDIGMEIKGVSKLSFLKFSE